MLDALNIIKSSTSPILELFPSIFHFEAEAVDRGDELQRSIQCEAQLRGQIFGLRDEQERLQASSFIKVLLYKLSLCQTYIISFLIYINIYIYIIYMHIYDIYVSFKCFWNCNMTCSWLDWIRPGRPRGGTGPQLQSDPGRAVVCPVVLRGNCHAASRARTLCKCRSKNG